MLTKLNTYFWYLYEYMKHGDFLSVYASVNYLIFKKSHIHYIIILEIIQSQ